MRFEEVAVAGASLVRLAPHEDDRGWFARAWCDEAFRAHGLASGFVQANLSKTLTRGAIRGMHFQHPPHAEDKLVRCIRGSIHDVVLDLRPDSPTYLRWAAATLSADNHDAMYLPKGCAHGFQALEDDCEVFYLVTAAYAPAAAGGVRWNDPAFAIKWPLPVTVVHDRDASYPDYRPGPRAPRTA